MKPVGLHFQADGALATGNFADPYLELVHLLTQAAGLEHSLMAAYLYAGFSLKPEYSSIRGEVTPELFGLHRLDDGLSSDLAKRHTMLDIAVEEMQHLGTVNELLRALGAAPVMTPHAFPFDADIYQFTVDLRPLSRPAAATFLWIEAEADKLVGDGPNAEPAAFRQLVHEALAELPDPVDDQAVSHLGSLYRAIIQAAERVADAPPPMVDPMADWPQWLARLDWVLGQGEIAHYQFFRGLFNGDTFLPDSRHPGIVWADPSDPIYPSHDLVHGSAWRGASDIYPDESVRQLAWLGNLHYWLILGLLDHSYRGTDRSGRYQAVGQMTRAIWAIGADLADTHQIGMPFDALRPSYQFGVDGAHSVQILLSLAEETQRVEERVASSGLLPGAYEPDALRSLIEQLRSDAS